LYRRSTYRSKDAVGWEVGNAVDGLECPVSQIGARPISRHATRMRPFALSEKRFNELVRLCNAYRREARRCLGARAYLAGCIMIGAALEACLVAMCHLYPRDIPRALVPTWRGDKKPLLRWTLNELLHVARGAHWLPAGLYAEEAWDNKKARIGDYALVVRDFRNLVHVARYLQDYPSPRLTKRRLEFCFEVLEVVVDHLDARVHRGLRAAFARSSKARP